MQTFRLRSRRPQHVRPHRFRRWIGAFVLVWAIADPAASESIEEGDILARLDRDSTLETVLQAGAALADAERLGATLSNPPRLSAEREEIDAEGVEWTWAVAWQPPTPGRRDRQRAASEAAWRAAEQEARVARLAARIEARAAFARWAIERARAELLADHADELSTLTAIAEARAAAGEIPGYVARRLRLDGERLRARARHADGVSLAARGDMEAWVGPLPDAAVPGLPPLPPPPDLDLDQVLADHPSLRADAFEAERDRWTAELAHRIIEAPEIELGWKRLETEGLSFDGTVFGVSWSVPLTSHRRAAVAEAEAEQAGSAARRVRDRRRIEVSIRQRLAALELHRQAALALPSDDPVLRRAVTLGFRLGEIDLSDTINTLDALRAAALESLDVLDATLAAHRALELVVGHPLETDS